MTPATTTTAPVTSPATTAPTSPPTSADDAHSAIEAHKASMAEVRRLIAELAAARKKAEVTKRTMFQTVQAFGGSPAVAEGNGNGGAKK